MDSLCALCLENPPTALNLNKLQSSSDLLQQIFESYNIQIPVREIHSRICPCCSDKLFVMCETLEDWREAQVKSIELSPGTGEIKLEPADVETLSPGTAEIKLEPTNVETLENEQATMETDDIECEHTNDNGPQFSLQRQKAVIYTPEKNVTVNFKTVFNCSQPGCSAFFTYQRNYYNHLQKCHPDVEIRQEISRPKKSIRSQRFGIKPAQFNDKGRGQFHVVQDAKLTPTSPTPATVRIKQEPTVADNEEQFYNEIEFSNIQPEKTQYVIFDNVSDQTKLRRVFNCPHEGCTAIFTYQRSYETHIQKCHLSLNDCRELGQHCETHSIPRYQNKYGVKQVPYKQQGKGQFYTIQKHKIQEEQLRQKLEKEKTLQANKKKEGHFLNLNTKQKLIIKNKAKYKKL